MSKDSLLTPAEIGKLLKQKPPFLFIDKVLELEPCKRIKAIKNVSATELFATCHFPGKPIYPGVFLIEVAAQAASILCSFAPGEMNLSEESILVLGGVQRFQFLRVVQPGDILQIEIEIVKMAPGGAIVKAVHRVDGEKVAEGQMTFGAIANG
ncbi:3-hydroxyacyl-ACP dehydratase FabZ [Paenibacillus sp. M1]|uniref:3-hydroxyacyl-ACP dehydratase FabZ n=1 Tax=Paenibacillus haidiansis TaxID=1574488 RepID=A0ABU7VRB9_9BACL